MLPEEYIVKCENCEESNKVYNNFYNDGYNLSMWKYIVCSKLIKNAQYAHTGKYNGLWCIEGFIRDEFEHLPVLTFKQWEEMKDEFTLPEKYCINFKNVSLKDKRLLIKSIDNTHSYNSYTNTTHTFYHFNGLKSIDCGRTTPATHNGYVEITIEQFKKHVMKGSKKLIGYKLKKEKYAIAAVKIEGYIFTGEDNIKGRIFTYDEHLDAINKWKEAKVLDEWFNPVYEKEEGFKIGDWVIANYNAGCEGYENKMAKILDGSTYRYLDGRIERNQSNFKFEKCRLATQEEILNHLQKEFTERTGIDIGSVVAIAPYKQRYIRGKIGHTNDSWYSNYEVRDFKLINNELFIDVDSFNWSKGDVWHIAEAIHLVKPKLTFGGSEVTLEKVSSGVRIKCGGETGTLSQLEKIYNAFFSGDSVHTFGSVILKIVKFNDGGEWNSDISNTPSQLTIGCTTGSAEEFLNILKEARKLN